MPGEINEESRKPGEKREEAAEPESQNQVQAPAPIEMDSSAPVEERAVVAPDSEQERPSTLPYYVVAIGASAGGIQALVELFSHLSADTGMAYVVLQHMPSDQKSHLTEILARHTDMQVSAIEAATVPKPNRVYVAPGRVHVKLDRGAFSFSPVQSADHTIDSFFYSLAAEQKNRAIGVVLSGMDGDGALGLRAIKGEGGFTMVQSPDSAQFPEMPRVSISTDHVDTVLPPSGIAIKIAELSSQLRGATLRLFQDGESTSEEERDFVRILELLRQVSGVDFRLYKPATIRRRMARRMLLHRIATVREYLIYLHANPAELRDLHEDALINVTHFFRDPDVFDGLRNVVFPRLFENRDRSQQVRIWVAGCSTGEEVYSIAMCLLEYVTATSHEPAIQIFGTDASERNIQHSRMGLYPESITGEVSQERLRRFFTRTEKGYQIAKRVRDFCIFARQNICSDPPFSRMDLISCRNVLIYFGGELQRQLIPVFHYALRPNGYLLLGTSETIREHTELFSLVDRRLKIYSRLGSDAGPAFMNSMPRTPSPDVSTTAAPVISETWGDVELQRAADRIVLARYGPPGVVVDERMEILQSRGHTSPFLEVRQGSATLQLSRMVRDNIAPVVTSAVKRAIDIDLPVQVTGLKIYPESGPGNITLEVLPIHSFTHRVKCYLVLFVSDGRPAEQHSALPAEERVEEKDRDRVIEQLRHELSSTRLYLQSLLEERDAKNQELISANEEIQSANEELQSTNEELETTKEELQSSNEELHTVNDELQNRNAVLTQATNDLQNLLTSVNIPVLMLNNQLNIRHFTAPTQRVMHLRSSDVGRPFGDIRMNLDVDDLTPLFQEVLDTLGSREAEVQDKEGHWHLLRVRPYRTADNKIEGLVVVLVDIDQLRKGQQDLRAARDFAASVMQGIPLPLTVIDLDFRIRSTNQAFCELTGISAQELNQRLFPNLAAVLWGLDEPLKEKLQALKENVDNRGAFEIEHRLNGDDGRTFSIRGTKVEPDSDQFLLITVEDIAAHKEVARLLTLEKDRLVSQVESATEALGRSQDELRALTGNLFTTQETERRRIARELHDDVSQRLGSLDIECSEARQAISTDPGLAASKLEAVRDRISALAEDVRRMSHRVHPSILEHLGIAAALRQLTEDIDANENMIATFSARSVPAAVPIDTATGLYRIAQEALRNAARHAGRSHVRVLLTGSDRGLQLDIIDSGHGFDPSEVRSGLGRISMEERARIIGGEFELKSALGEGTRVTVRVELPRS